MLNKDNKIKVFGSDDDLKTLGELLSNETSREIITSLMVSKMYTNEIATKLGVRVSLVIYHLKKLELVGLLDIINKKIKRKGEEHRFFKMSSDIFITLDKNKEEIKESGILKKIFTEGIKFGSIGLAGLFIWSVDLTHLLEASLVYPIPFGGDDVTNTLTPALLIIIIGLIIERIFSRIKKKKRD